MTVTDPATARAAWGTAAAVLALVLAALATRLPTAGATPRAILSAALPTSLAERLPLLGSRGDVSYVVRDVSVASIKNGLLTFDVDCTARVAGMSMSGHVAAAQGRDGTPRWVGPAPEAGLGAGGDPEVAARVSDAVGRAVLDYVAALPGDVTGAASPSSSIANTR